MSMRKKKSTLKRTAEGLTSQQDLFCHEYIKDRNGTQAAIRAKYSVKTANEQAARLLAKASVRYKINRLIEVQLKRIDLTADFIIKELLKLATFDLQDIYDAEGSFLPIEDMPETVRKAIASIEVEELFDGKGKNKERIGYAKKIKFWNKGQALELLGKHLKMFADTNIDQSRHLHLTVEKREEILAGIRDVAREGLLEKI